MLRRDNKSKYEKIDTKGFNIKIKRNKDKKKKI